MQINQYNTIRLSHRNYFGIKGNNDTASWLIASGDGNYTIFDANGITTTSVLQHPVTAIDFLPQQQLIAWCADKKMQLQTVNGNKVFDRQGAFSEVYFSAANGMLWTIESEDGETAVVTVTSIATGATIASVEIADEYTDSAYSFYPGAHDNHLVLFMAAGQDGQSTFFLTLGNGTLFVVKLQEEDTSPAIFNKSATIFILVGEEEMYVYRFPQQDLLRTIELPDDHETAYYFGFINDQQVIMAGGSLQSIINVYSGELLPVIIKGHGPQPVNFYYPRIADYGEKTTDIEGVDVFGNHIFFHCRNHQDPKEEKHSILIARVNDLL